MSIEIIAILIFVGVPIAIGFISGVTGISQSTRGEHSHAWRYVKDDPVYEEPVFEMDEEELDNAPYMALEEIESSLQQTMVYENSEPSAEMRGAIDELLSAIGAPIEDVTAQVADHADIDDLIAMASHDEVVARLDVDEPLADSDLDWLDGDFKDVQLEVAATVEPEVVAATITEPKVIVELTRPPVAREPVEIYEQIQSEKLNNLIHFPVDYAPTPLPFGEYSAIERKYGSAVAQSITTTPGQGGTGKEDVMIGRLEQNTVGYVLSYADCFIPLKGDIPKKHVGKAMLLLGQFVSQEEFYILESDDPEVIAHNSKPPFEKKLTVSV